MPELTPHTRGFHAAGMGWASVRIDLTRWVAAACVVAMAALGFAQKHTLGLAPAALDLSAFALPDGTLPTICRTVGSDESGPDGPIMARFCGLCLLVVAPGLPPPPEAAIAAEPGPDAFAGIPPADGAVRLNRSTHVPHLRGPPPIVA